MTDLKGDKIEGKKDITSVAGALRSLEGRGDSRRAPREYDALLTTRIEDKRDVGFTDAVYNENTSLNTPDKTLTFLTVDNSEPADGVLDGVNSSFVQRPDGSYRLDVDIVGVEKQKLFAWLAANAAQDEEGNFYVKSMYASNDGGLTRLPVYVNVDYDEFSYVDPLTGDNVRVSEKPVGIYVEFKPGVNVNENMQPQLASLEFFMDRDIASVTDYIDPADAAKQAAPMMGSDWTGYSGYKFLHRNQYCFRPLFSQNKV